MENCLKSKLAPKLERKYVEKNRRNHMKNLCNQLHSMLPTTHASTSKINRSSTMEFSATTLCDKMKELIYGNDVDSQLHLWDYKIEFDALELLPTRSQNQNMYIYMQNEYEIPTFF
ncbi:hypothetical protein MTR67_042420 [Solanum verrucosum]|uniref:BHLH domain-containing protein n=1 Tax=Solanum verrucosum TaxID=315347 RepID=A0AAF0UNF2_SOLVR|nr:hypothetical protein MTR67_042420 [Solanum verrucosum]